MHILLYLNRFGIGGIQTFVIQLANELARQPGIRVSIFCHYPDQLDRKENVALDTRVGVYAVTRQGWQTTLLNHIRNILHRIGIAWDIKEWLTHWRFRRLLRTEKVDVVHSNSVQGDMQCVSACSIFPISFISTLHAAYKDLEGERLSAHRDYLLALQQQAHRVVYLSSANLRPFQQALRGAFIPQVYTRIFNGFAAPYTSSKKKGTNFVFGMIARGHWDKGWQEAIEAFIALYQELGGGIQLQLWGGGDCLPVLQVQVQHPGVHFCGATAEPLSILEQIHVGLLPTIFDEMPMTIVEYLATGTPAISTDVGAIKQMLTAENGIAGVIVPIDETTQRASVQAIQDAMREYVLFPEVYAQHVSRTALAYRQFSMQQCAASYMQLYQKALSKDVDRPVNTHV